MYYFSEVRYALDALVKDSYAWFRGLVKERRGMDDELLQKVADGRVFTGRETRHQLSILIGFVSERNSVGERPELRRRRGVPGLAFSRLCPSNPPGTNGFQRFKGQPRGKLPLTCTYRQVKIFNQTGE